MPAPAVHFRDVRFTWPGAATALLDGFTATAAPATVTALVGPSGCGKSTLLRLAAGLLSPSAGTVDAGGAAPGDRAYVFQAPTLLPWRTVAENVGLPLEILGDLAPDDPRVRAALAQVELTEAAHQLPHQLSGGMQMRASLARALVTRPTLLLLDEPFSALDAATRRRVQQVFARAWTDAGATVLLVTHDLDEAVLLADRVLTLGERPLQVTRSVEVDLPSPRTPELRHDPALGRLVRTLEAVL